MPVEVDETVKQRRWREGQRRVVVVDGLEVAPVHLYLLVEVLDAVLAKGSVTLDGEPLSHINTCLQLYAQTVGVLDVRGQVLADFRYLTRLYELIGVVHEVAIDAKAPCFGIQRVP